MPGLRNRRFTIYDAMEAAGIFEANPANSYSRDVITGDGLYKGPVEYPKMFYHPKGETRISVPAEVIELPSGRIIERNEQRELIHAIANNSADERRLRDDGWHDHPSDAMRAGGDKNAPLKTSGDRIAQLESEIRRLQAEKDAQAAEILAATARNPLTPISPGSPSTVEVE